MKKRLFTLTSLIVFVIQGFILNAQNVTPDFSTWTDEQIQQWEDSVKNALYPNLEIKTAAIPDTSKFVINKVSAQITNNTYVPDSVTIDKTKAVGEIPFQSGVSSTGAVTYNVPIEVYQGIHGMQPNLSIAYNSQAGNGILGLGWNISGLSSITRSNQSIYYDGKSQGITITKNDAFYLDGMRLIKISETSAQIKYESEMGNIKVTANLNGLIIKYFDVYFPNGTKGTYGYTANANTSYLEYPITSLSDLCNNTITYTYSYINNRYRIDNISYSNALVEFQYGDEARLDKVITYIGGMKTVEDKLLQKIICKFGSTVLRNYDFSYTDQRNTSLLTQIDYSAANGSSFNPLKFYYGENNTDKNYISNDTQLSEYYNNWTSPNQIRVQKGKFDYGADNDGLIVTPYPQWYSYWQHHLGATYFRHSQNRFDNYYSGTEKIFLYTGLNSSWASPMPNLTTEAGFIDVLCANVDGKYEDEVIKVNDVVSGSNDKVTFNVYSASATTGLGFRYPLNSRTFNFPTVLTDANGGKSIHPKFYFTGDFNGDGKMEVLAVSCNQPFGWTDNPTKCYLFDLDSNIKLYEGQSFAYNVTFVGTNQADPDIAAQNTDRLYVLDYDGDGKSDICLINTNGAYIYTFDISGSSYSMRQVAFYSGLKRSDLDGRELLLGEFNGDGKPDFLLSPKVKDTDWYIFYSMGNGQFEKVPVTVCVHSNGYGYLLQDFNSDGLLDVIAHTSYYFFTYKSIHGGFYLEDNVSSINSGISMILVPTDINDRNYFNQLVGLRNDGKVTRFSYRKNDIKERLLTGAVTSMGVVSKNYYRMLNESPGVFTQGNGASFPYENFKGPLFVAESREQYFNGELNEKRSYTYENAVIHKQGRGFCGFQKINTYDNVRGRTEIQTFDPYNFGVLKEDDSPTTKTTNIWSVSIASNKIAKVLLTNQSVLDKSKNISISHGFSNYDTYGNPLNESVNYGDGIIETIINSYINNTNESSYLLGFLNDQTKTTYRKGPTWTERHYTPTYYNGQPTMRYNYVNGNQVLSEYYGYDSRGNPNYKWLVYYSGNTFRTSYVYDSYGRLTKETDPLGFNTTYEYSASNGSLSAIKNHKEQATTYGYDPFFRQVSYTYPEGTNGVTQYSWNAAGTNGLYCIYKCESGNPWTKTYYDALGRETASSGLNFDYSEPRTEKQYDSYGRLQSVSLPSFGSPAYWNTYQYDNYDRPTKLTEASGRTTSYSYSGNSVTTTEDGITSTQTFDNQGNLTQVTDPGGTITYNLRPDGQPTSIVAPGNVTTSFNYDSYGRRLSIVDPSAGMQSCTYDAAGNIATETDANNKTVNYQYDAYNRLTNKICPEFSATYTYNTDGMLDSESSNSGTSTSYQYDIYGRLYTKREMVPDGKCLEKKYSYANSYLQSIQYTSQNGPIVTENYYYDAGHLTEIKLNGTTSIWKLNSENAFGQPTKVATGSFGRTYSYNAYGLPTGRMAGSFQDQSYTFDAAKGNLSRRLDNLKYTKEDFTYDNLNRLTGYEGKTAAYDFKGNITSKTDVGTFEYNTSGMPYAISEVASPTNLIPQRNQTITYTSFKRPATITEGEYTAAFTYNGNDERVKMELKRNGEKYLTRYYISDCYEIDDRAVGGIKEKLYLSGDFYTAAAAYVRTSSGSWQLYYIFRDYQGSIIRVSNSGGSEWQDLSYDAWGQLRNPANQTVYAPDSAPELFLGRGYTGHEHLPMFGLINMNARLYDPALGRVLSPDPFVQNPLFSQGFNRYSYAMNNPMSYIDRDGQFPFLSVGIMVAFTYLMLAHNNTPKDKDAGNPANWAWNPGSWFKPTPNNPNPTGIMVTVGGSPSGGNFYGNVAVGNTNGPMPAFGYSSDYGFGFGYNNNGSSNMYYPAYNYNAPEQAADKAINSARTAYLWSNGNDNWWSSAMNYIGLVSTAWALTASWTVGIGGIKEVTFSNDPIANALKSSAGVKKAIEEYYATGKKEDYYPFGLSGLHDAGLNPIQQFVGGYHYKITEIEGRLQFTITNTTSFASASYHLWPYKWNWGIGPMSNFKQTYIFIY